MALSWSMDKLGPICRTVEDCVSKYGEDDRSVATQRQRRAAHHGQPAHREQPDFRVARLRPRPEATGPR
jgi:Asp-tRNA(Asn)/Glu-tRNA(Gln) amidotransferase A subunit family amidase